MSMPGYYDEFGFYRRPGMTWEEQYGDIVRNFQPEWSQDEAFRDWWVNLPYGEGANFPQGVLNQGGAKRWEPENYGWRYTLDPYLGDIYGSLYQDQLQTEAARAAQTAPTTTPSGGGGGGYFYGGGGGGARTSVNVPSSFYEAPAPFDFGSFQPPAFNAPTFAAPAPFEYDAFSIPSADDVLAQSPGYEFRRQEGARPLTNAASARGVLRSGAYDKALGEYLQNFASQEYSNVYNRRFNEWLANRSAAAEDYDRTWRNALTEYSLGYNQEVDEYNRALQTYGANFQTAATRQGFDLDAAAAAMSGRSQASAQRLGQEGTLMSTLLGLYDLSTRNLPRYEPTYSPSYTAGFAY